MIRHLFGLSSLVSHWSPERHRRNRLSASAAPLTLFACSSLLSGCSSQEEAGWHIGIYMAADNNLDGAASSDLIELARAKSNGASRVTVFIDRAPPEDYSPAKVPGLEASETARIVELSGKEYVVVEELGEVDSLAVPQVRDFLKRIDDSPEAHKAIIFWDHGSPDSFGSDDTNKGPPLNLESLTSAFQIDPDDESAGTYHFDVVGFDTCLMGSFAALQAFSSLADVYIGSAELEPGSGWNYEGIREGLQDPDMSARDFGALAVDAYGDYYTQNPNSTNQLAVTLAAWETDLQEVDAALFALASALGEQPAEGAAEVYADISKALSKATPYNSNPARPPHTVDFGDVLTQLSTDTVTDVATAAGDMLDALSARRIAWASDPSISSALGLSAASPASGSADQFVEEAAGFEAVGREHLIAQDMEDPVVSLTWDGVSENSLVDFGLVQFSASDDVLLDQARISLARAEADGSTTLFSSFRVDEASAEISLEESSYGVPLGTLSFDAAADSLADEDLAMLLLDAGQLRLAATFEINGDIHRGLINLDDDLMPDSVVLEHDEHETTTVIAWSDLLTHPGVTIAPDLGSVAAGTHVVERVSGRMRPIAELNIGAVALGAEMGLLVVASAADLTGSITSTSVAVP